MSCETSCCVLTRGEFFIGDWEGSCIGGLSEILCNGTPRPLKKVGNVTTCLVQIDSRVLGKENQFNPLSKTCSRVQVAGVDISITMTCASRSNLYRALYGEKPPADSGTHIKDFCFETLESCDFFPFEKQQALESNLHVYLRDALGNVVSELVRDVDFSFSTSGIELLQDLDPDNASILRLSYEYNNADFYEIDFLKKYIGYKKLHFKGTNYAEAEGGMFDAIFNKVLFAPINQFDLITSDGFFTITLTGSVEKDDGSWFKLIKQES